MILNCHPPLQVPAKAEGLTKRSCRYTTTN